MSAPPYMKLYVADYLADTLHLTRGEHGAYLLLLMAMWRAGGKLPATDAKLAQITKCTAREWAEVRGTVLDLFQRRGGQITHKRLNEELASYRAISDVRKEASDRGVAAKRNKINAEPQPNGRRKRDHLVTKPESESKNPLAPKGGQIVLPDWEGSQDILAALSDAKDRAWALTWLRHCREQHLPFRALVTADPVTSDRLNQEAEGALRRIGVRVILEAAA